MMRKLLPLTLLTAGVGISASFASRVGATQADRLTSDSLASLRAGAVAAVTACVDDEDLTDEDRADCLAKAEAPWRGEGLVPPTAEEAEAAEHAAALLTVPGPTQRVTEWSSVAALGWGGGLSLIVIGAVMGRRAIQAEAAAGGASTGDRVHFRPAVAGLRRAAQEIRVLLDGLGDGQDSPEARGRLEVLVSDVIDPLVDTRGMLVAKHGVGVFAEYFGPFSAGERNLARAWSALTDGHPDVARDALDAAAAAFGQALVVWDRVDTV